MSFFSEVHHFVLHYGYIAIFLGIFLEGFGMPTPGETLLITGGVLASHDALNIRWLLLLAWLAVITGNNIGFLIGRTGGHRILLRYGGRLGLTQTRLAKIETFLDRYGVIVIVAAPFFVPFRQLAGIVCGTLDMPWRRFALFNAIGAALWVGFWGGLSYWLGKRIFEYIGTFSRITPVVIGLVILALAVLGLKLLWHYLRQRHHHRLS